MKKIAKLISLLLTVSVFLTAFVGCSAVQKAQTTVSDMFTALKSLDMEKASNYINVDEVMKTDTEDENAIDAELFKEKLFGALAYEIVSAEQIDKTKVIVKTKVTTIDMKPVLQDYFVKALQYAFANAFANPQPTEEETNKKMTEILNECISKEDLALVTNEVDITVVKVDNKWKIETDEALANALLGGFATATKELNSSLNSED